MSRIIVKNIPNGFEETKLRNHFSTCGIITDVQLKYTPEGKFRNFGYIGFQTDEQAEKAIKHFDNSFIRTSKIAVSACVPLSETKKLKVWSKHAKNRSEPVPPEKEERQTEEPKEKPKEKPKPQTAKDVLGQYQNDPQFQEFLDAHKRAGKTIWDNQLQQKSNDTDAAPAGGEKKPASDDSAVDVEPSEKSKPSKKPEKKKEQKPLIPLFVAKMQNLPSRIKRQAIIRFFKTVKPHSVRVPPKIEGIAFVGFKMESELQKALLMDKSFLGGKQVRIVDYTEHNNLAVAHAKNDPAAKKLSKWERQAKANASGEAICESGKLFFRNLSYAVKEEDIRALFEQYGPVTEVDVPIDSVTRKLKGFGTVTFMIPEHAVTAYNELNGTFLQGRMFHILPAKVSDDPDTKEGDEHGSDYQKKKEQTLKKTAQSSHNWNTLFIGENAVAEAVAKKYGTSKEQILVSSEGETSAAVRLALGETELVLEMQTFLQENNISLEAFNSTDGKTKRSNTVILVKNLAPGCTVAALRQLFAPFGLLGRVVLPPSAVTAVIEFLDPSEARKAFKKLAYSMFQSLPLYLEWAPSGTFTTPPPDPSEIKKDSEATVPSSVQVKEEKPDLVDDTEPEDGTTLFIRNLPFSTNEDTIRERFRTVGAIHSVQIARSKDLSGTGKNESRGYGFIQFKRRQAAEYALKNLHSVVIDGRAVELVRSDRTLQTDHNRNDRKKPKAQNQTGSKILVRNIPFQASAKEVRDLFKPFGDIKTLRLPKKMAAGADESHRGFGFVEFVEESDATRAFNTLGRSTHLYGRRLVLEWAAPDNDVEELRKRTADQFGHGGSSAKRTAHGKGVLLTEEFVSAAQRTKEEDDDDYDEGYANGSSF
ncbi:probable RNA-binding protein 19 [Anopheles stephensi]|uniref:RRM domain-containing protein n=1 Tax=Anopheles stephensi TaxID=30069 RepID=A0A182YBZ9_ANOST|nr:probable RNA-binding protein 19 [Anopheles stephensi]